jgi:hypothetical protein
MSDDEIAKVGESGPTIDTIEIAEFESRASINEWIGKKAPAFSRSPSVRPDGPGR